MDPVSLVALIVIVVLVVCVATPQGRAALGSIVNGVGSALAQLAGRTENVELMRAELASRTENETRAALQNAEDAYARATAILDEEKGMEVELEKWTANRDDALDQTLALTQDNTPDEQQQEEIGRLKAIGQASIDKINGIQAALEANKDNYSWATQIIAQSEELFHQLPEQAAAMLRQGNVDSATVALTQAQKQTAAGQSAFSDSKAQQVLARMNSLAAHSRAQAKAATARSVAAPASADVAASMLARAKGSRTNEFDDMLNAARARLSDTSATTNADTSGEPSSATSSTSTQ